MFPPLADLRILKEAQRRGAGKVLLRSGPRSRPTVRKTRFVTRGDSRRREKKEEVSRPRSALFAEREREQRN